MRSLIRKCPNRHGYTMKEACTACGAQTVTVHPARYSPDDRYARYRSPLAYQDSS